MKEYQSLNHTGYHFVFILQRHKRKYWRTAATFGVGVSRVGVAQESKIVEGHMMRDHVHTCLSIPPKYAVSNVVGYLKGTSAIQIARKFGGHTTIFEQCFKSEQKGKRRQDNAVSPEQE